MRRTLVSMIVFATMVAVFVYLIVRCVLFVAADYLWYEKALALLLLLAETFLLTHSFGYFLNIHRVLARGRKHAGDEGDPEKDLEEPESFPGVGVIVSSYHEPIEVVTQTLICFHNLTYPNKRIFFLDDTRYDLPGKDPAEMAEYRKQVDAMCREMGVTLFRRRWRGAKAGMINDFLDYLDRGEDGPYEVSDFSRTVSRDEIDYVVVFDADQNPFPDFVERLVARMEREKSLAFIQTPQYYTNFETNRVARAAGLQQAVFYEYICEGKSMEDAMFCCGTNVIFRRAALVDVGGFDESSVTEDFATSLRFHAAGWSSRYLNRICAFGMGPEDLGGYFKQQFRWALGTVGLMRTIAVSFVRSPGALPAGKWWEYFLSGTHYFVGWVFFVMMLCPVLFVFTSVPSYFVRPDIYFLFFFPYIVLSLSIFAFTLSQRRYGLRELAQGIVLQALCFPVYMRASLLALAGVRGTFGITPKGGSRSLPLAGLWAQVGMSLILAAAFVYALMRIYYERDQVLALAVNAFWCFYSFMILSTFLYFNFPREDQ